MFTQDGRVGAWVLRPPGFLFMFSRNVQAVGDVSICRGRVSRPVFPNLHRVSIYTIPVALSSWRTTGGVCEKSAGRDVLRTSKPVPYHTKGRFRNRSCAHVRPPPSSLREQRYSIMRRAGAYHNYSLFILHYSLACQTPRSVVY